MANRDTKREPTPEELKRAREWKERADAHERERMEHYRREGFPSYWYDNFYF